MNRFLHAIFCTSALLFSLPAYAVNENHAASEAADRSVILDAQEKNIPVDRSRLNIPDPKRNTVNGPNSPTHPDSAEEGGY